MDWMSHSTQETEQIGAMLYKQYGNRRVFALYGDLGAGKTALTRGIAQAAETIDPATSPTYTIVNEYRGKRKLAHFDMYRMGGSADLEEIGWEDYLDSGALCIVEWSERVQGALPADTLHIRIDKIAAEVRRITVTP